MSDKPLPQKCDCGQWVHPSGSNPDWPIFRCQCGAAWMMGVASPADALEVEAAIKDGTLVLTP